MILFTIALNFHLNFMPTPTTNRAELSYLLSAAYKPIHAFKPHIRLIIFMFNLMSVFDMARTSNYNFTGCLRDVFSVETDRLSRSA